MKVYIIHRAIYSKSLGDYVAIHSIYAKEEDAVAALRLLKPETVGSAITSYFMSEQPLL